MVIVRVRRESGHSSYKHASISSPTSLLLALNTRLAHMEDIFFTNSINWVEDR